MKSTRGARRTQFAIAHLSGSLALFHSRVSHRFSVHLCCGCCATRRGRRRRRPPCARPGCGRARRARRANERSRRPARRRLLADARTPRGGGSRVCERATRSVRRRVGVEAGWVDVARDDALCDGRLVLHDRGCHVHLLATEHGLVLPGQGRRNMHVQLRGEERGTGSVVPWTKQLRCVV